MTAPLRFGSNGSFGERCLDVTPGRSHDQPMDDLEPIDPREAERIRRRDHDADAEARSLMRPGMGKVFKQIQDSWATGSARKRPKPRRQPRP